MDPIYDISPFFSNETTFRFYLPGNCLLIFQLHSYDSASDFSSSFLLCPLMFAFIFEEQLYKILMEFLLKILKSLVDFGKCSSSSFRDRLSNLVFSDLQKDGL